MTLTEKVKKAIRATDDFFDSETADAISSAVADMKRAGVNVGEYNAATTETLGDPLYDRAAILYAKSEFNFDGDADRYRKAYDYLLCSLSLSGEYID